MVNKRKISGSENHAESLALAGQVKRQKECQNEEQAHQSSNPSNCDDTGHLSTMSSVKLAGDALGEKHRHYNKLVEDAIANTHYELCNISAEDSDIDNLLKIDVACKTRKVDYIIEVMKSNDMLYAATAIKKSTWLITEQQYADIINPEYLHTQLAPNMNTKTFNKLMLHIRLNLKDESRVETFYEYLKESDGAYKWLEHCSIPFVENVIRNKRRIPLSLFKRLCRRSAHFLTFYTRVESQSMSNVKKEILFLLKSHTADVLNIVEDTTLDYIPEIGKKKTKFLIKTCPQRIVNQFSKYGLQIDLSVVAKYLNKKEIKAFLCKQGNYNLQNLWDYDTLKYFIENMPEEERFEFVRKTFIEKTELSLFCTEEGKSLLGSKINPYQWYEFAPFNVAFRELKKIIRTEKSPSERCAMLSVLITCANRNNQHVKILLNFFKDKHINEPFKFKIQFVNNLLSRVSTHEFDVETWNVLDQLFHSMEVYTESKKNVQQCLQSIVLNKVLHDEPVPKTVEQNMEFDTFQKYQIILNQEQNEKIFTYLLNSLLTNIRTINVSNESDFDINMLHLKNIFTLLNDWKKDISCYPFVMQKLQELVNVKKEHLSEIDSDFYNMNKSWRKHMFEESLSLCLSEEACLNALKHKPQLLTRYDKQIDTLRTDDAVSLPRLLAKLRVYWPHSLAQHWINAYLLNVNKPTGQKAAVRGLFMLLPQNQVTDMARKHAPDEFWINWGETEQVDIVMRKNIAKNLHVARPQISLDTILLYAKGDYLQHAVPSLNAILYNMSEIESREQVPKLLHAPVSLKKFGLHLVYSKLKTEELMSKYSDVFKKADNISIQGIIFRHTHERLCTVKNPTVEKELWELLNLFFNHVFCATLGHAERVPISVRAEYFKRAYTFIEALPRSDNFEHYEEELIKYAPNIMDLLDADFVADEMLSAAGFKFCSYESQFIDIFGCYILCGKSEEDQLQRFRRVVEPAMEEAFQQWDKMRSGRYYVRDNFKSFLESLVWNFRIYITLMKIPMPTKLFMEIVTKIETHLPVLKNYVLCTSFKLIAEYVKLLDDEGCVSIAFEFLKVSESQFQDGQMLSAMENVWKHIYFKISPSLGPIIVKCLKEATELYSPTIYCLFVDAFKNMFQLFTYQNSDMYIFLLETLKYMLNDSDFVPSYLVVSKVLPKDCKGELKDIQSEIRKKLKSHPSTIVQLHNYNDCKDIKQLKKISSL